VNLCLLYERQRLRSQSNSSLDGAPIQTGGPHQISGRAHGLLVRLHRIEERAARGTDNAA
jgi:hypothetical protein